MEQILIGIIVLGVVLVAKRKQAFTLRWHPERGTWAAVATGILAFLLSTSLLLLEPGSLISRIVLYVGIWLVCGTLIPWGYLLLVERDTPAGLGLRKDRWMVSLLISLALAAFFSLVILFEADLSALDSVELGRSMVVLIGAGGLFELFLYYGFIHIRLEKAFGPLPAILMTAVLYGLWHTGTQLPMEPNQWMGALKLLGVGMMYQAVFSLTYNLLIIWPFFLGMGVIIDFMVNLGDLEPISAAYPWGVGVIMAMVICASLIWLVSPRQSDPLAIHTPKP